ncbi:Flavin-containing monooxygenase FMO GS-OX-like 9 [Acorus calamus]|uniref:Flavin-containing monooxygenase FMO GS-OX-like 9 n=1 Tax=Acorus calamus TaxID=4465 RepID=A0AAV9EZZ1_ACOCL|nr:Flavin-containing monooxygenase FMO GS-OX-like 9 [Acorus calamus]
MKTIKEFYQSRDAAGIPKHNTHDICDFEYCDKYGENCGFPHLEDWRKELCLSALRSALINLETYRDTWDEQELLQMAHQSNHFTARSSILDLAEMTRRSNKGIYDYSNMRILIQDGELKNNYVNGLK